MNISEYNGVARMANRATNVRPCKCGFIPDVDIQRLKNCEEVVKTFVEDGSLRRRCNMQRNWSVENPALKLVRDVKAAQADADHPLNAMDDETYEHYVRGIEYVSKAFGDNSRLDFNAAKEIHDLEMKAMEFIDAVRKFLAFNDMACLAHDADKYPFIGDVLSAACTKPLSGSDVETIEWDFREAEAIRNSSDEVVEDFDDVGPCDDEGRPVADDLRFIDEDIEDEVDEETDEMPLFVDDK